MIEIYEAEYKEAKFFETLLDVLIYGNSEKFRNTMQDRIKILERSGMLENKDVIRIYRMLMDTMEEMENLAE